MMCRHCGTEIADRAIVCYRCGRATAEPRAKPAGAPARRRGRSRAAAWAAAAAWLAGAVVVWNVAFDARIERGARDYVDRQRAYVEGRGPRADMDQVMDAARQEGLRAAWRWTAVELAPGAALAGLVAVRARRARRGPPPAAR